MSVKKLTKTVMLNSKVAKLKFNEKPIATAYVRGNLYEFEIEVPEKATNLCSADGTILWHRRLGHLCKNGMKAMHRGGARRLGQRTELQTREAHVL